MLKNYIKTAWRNLLKNKFYSAINIVGLALGLCIGILVLLWVQDELSFDGFHKNSKDIYRVEIFGGTGPSRQIWSVEVAPIGMLAKKELPEVTDAVRITGNGNYALYKNEDKVFTDENAIFADPSLFSVFSFPLIEGNTAKPFADDNSVVITRSTAQKFFGDADPIGKTISTDTEADLTVSGVIADIPANSSLKFDMVMPMSFHIKYMLQVNHMDMNTNFGQFAYETYLQLKPGANLSALPTKLRNIHLKHKADDTDVEYLLLPLSKMHLYNADMTANGITTVRIFIVIALLILAIACINYVNLSTARAMLRAKEISMRKIIGAAKTQLFLQFIIETVLLFAFAVIIALGLLFVLMPVFDQLSGKQITFNITNLNMWLVILAAVVGTLLASSIYPALLLSSFQPLKALKGKITASIGDVMFRKILVVTQFSVSVILIVGTLVITRQLNYIRNKDLGYNKTNVFCFPMRGMAQHYDAIRAELLQQPGIAGVTRSNQNIVRYGGLTGNVDWAGKDPNQNLLIHPIVVDQHFIPFFKIKLVAGSAYTGAVADTANFILNQAAIKEMGMQNPVGKSFTLRGIKGRIIGIAKDFHYTSMRQKIQPAILQYLPSYANNMYIKTTGTNAQQAIAVTQAEFKKYNGEYPFNYVFLDSIFDKLYRGEQSEGTVFIYFAGIAILISCLGLLGLAAYTAQVRFREIGVRKVLGASVNNIIGLLAGDFIKLVLIAILIATPIAWYAMSNWLQGFAYRENLSWQVFAIAGAAAVVIAFITISLQSIKAALANPVKSLRSE